MRLVVLLAATAVLASAADTLEVFGHRWSVPNGADWKVDQEGGTPVLDLVTHRGPLPGPRRPIQFAIADTPPLSHVVLDVDVKPKQKSLLIVFAYQDEAHFDYAHFSTDTGTRQPVHNGVFHVYGGERVRISNVKGPASFAASGEWYHVRLTYDGDHGHVSATVNGTPVPALDAYDVSLGAGKIGLGSFDEAAVFKNVKISR
jgi:hypothetical protein